MLAASGAGSPGHRAGTGGGRSRSQITKSRRRVCGTPKSAASSVWIDT
jgi:hypothetical protein